MRISRRYFGSGIFISLSILFVRVLEFSILSDLFTVLHLGEGLKSTGRAIETSEGNHSCTDGSVE